MGGCYCCLAYSPDSYRRAEVDTLEVYGRSASNMRAGPYFNSEGVILSPGRPKVPIPGQAAQLRLEDGKAAWVGLELSYQWRRSTQKGVQPPPAQVLVGPGLEWKAAQVHLFNSALLKKSNQGRLWSREEVLFAATRAGGLGTIVLSTGLVLDLHKKDTLLKEIYHIFDLRQIGASPSTNGGYQVDLTFGDLLPGLNGASSKPHRRNAVYSLVLNKAQLEGLVEVLRKLTIAHLRSEPQLNLPADVSQQVVPAMPACDGGFLARLYAVMAYFGHDLNKDVKIGEDFFSGVPLLELDISGFAPLNKDSGLFTAIRMGLETGFGFRGLICRGRALGPFFNSLFPALKLCTLLKLHLPDCKLQASDTAALFKTLGEANANSIVDFDLSMSCFDAQGLNSFVQLINITPGGLRALRLKKVTILRTSDHPLEPLLKVVANQSPRLNVLSLSQNQKLLPNPDALKPIWDAPLEVLEIGETGLNLGALLQGVTANSKAMRSLRQLDFTGLDLPGESLTGDFFSALGLRLERITLAGVGDVAKMKAVLIALGKKPRPNLQLELGGTNSSAVAIMDALGSASTGLLPDIRLATGEGEGVCQVFIDAAVTMIQANIAAKNRKLVGPQLTDELLKALPPSRSNLPSKAFGNMKTRALDLSSELAGKKTTFLVLPAASGSFYTSEVATAVRCGAGPSMARSLLSLAENKSIETLDLSYCLGGDAVGVALGATLKKNRTLRSITLHGNYFSVVGLQAIRACFYGNKKIVEFPVPTEDVEEFKKQYQTAMSKLQANCVQYKAKIKSAFKSTKGRRTTAVTNTLKEQVSKIRVDKGMMAKMRYSIKRYGELIQEIQTAVSRNQKDDGNLEADEKYQAVAWKEASKSLGTMVKLHNTAEAQKESNSQALWKEQEALSRAWITRLADLKENKKDATWLQGWVEECTKDGKVVITAQTAQSLLVRVPTSLAHEVKDEVTQTKEFIKLEEEVTSQAALLNSQISAQRLDVMKIQSAPGWQPPPLAGAKGVPAGAAAVLQKPVLPAMAPPPPQLIQAKVVQPAPTNNQTSSGTAPVAGGTIVAGTVLAVGPPTAATTTSQYDQFYAYQQQQSFHQGRLFGRVAGAPGAPQPVPCRPIRRARGMGDHSMGASMGMYMWCWHSSPGFYPDPYYGYSSSYYDPTWNHDYDQYDHCTDDCGWVEQHAEEPVSGFDPLDGMDVPPDGFGADFEGLGEAAGAVEMYAGGEDDRPGRGPWRDGASRAAKALWVPEPAQLDFLQKFLAEVEECEKEAKEEALGRMGRLPCRRERVVHTGSATSLADGICLVTQCSLDRLARLEAQLARWDGEVSAAVYVDGDPTGLPAMEARQLTRETCARAARRRIERGQQLPAWAVTLVYQLSESEMKCRDYDCLYPVNTLRNIALEASRSPLVFLLDVDFEPSSGLHAVLCGEDKGRRLRETLAGSPYHPPAALVIPAFEASHRRVQLPLDGEDLRMAEAAGDVEPFHVSHFPKGHRNTDFERWLHGAAPGSKPQAGRMVLASHGIDAYPVDYEEHFEPYVVMDRSRVPAYDERFRGYGLNKISHLYAVNAQGTKFCTVEHADAFVVAARHGKSNSWKACVGPEAEACQRARIAMHYANFKQELCVGAKPVTQSPSTPSTLSSASPTRVVAKTDVPSLWLHSSHCARTAQDLVACDLSFSDALVG